MEPELTRQQRRHLARIGEQAKREAARSKLGLPGHCPTHKMVAKLAKELAAQTYDMWASKVDSFAEAFPSQEAYASEAWPMFTEMAVATLAKTLAHSQNEVLKNEISSALILDAPLRAKRKGQIPQFYFD